jgi:hypothetical protein
MSARYNVSRNLQIYGSITNLFDKVAPLDPLTYGGMSYNPMDASGAIGRYFKLGLRYRCKHCFRPLRRLAQSKTANLGSPFFIA